MASFQAAVLQIIYILFFTKKLECSIAEVSGITATAASSSVINVAWTAVPSATKYDILYKRNDGISNDAGVESTASASKQISGRMKYARYIINVRAATSSEIGSWSSSPATVTTLEDVPNSSPSSMDLVKSGGTLNISWEEIPEIGRGGIIQGYYLTYFKASGGSVTVISTQSRTQTLTGLDPAQEYAVYIIGFNKIGNGTASVSGISNTKPYFDYASITPLYCYQVIPGSPLRDKSIGCWVFPAAAFVLVVFISVTGILLCIVAYKSGNKSFQRYETFMEEYSRHYLRKEKKVDTGGGLLFGKKRLPPPISVFKGDGRSGTALSQSNVLLVEEAEW